MFGERSLNERHNLAKLRTHGGVIFTDVREIASGIVLLALVPSCCDRRSAASRRSAAKANQCAGLLSSVLPSFIEPDSAADDFLVECAVFPELLGDAFRRFGKDRKGEICKICGSHHPPDFDVAVQFGFDAAADHEQVHVAVFTGFAVSLAAKENDSLGPDALDNGVQAGFELVRDFMHWIARITQSGKLHTLARCTDHRRGA